MIDDLNITENKKEPKVLSIEEIKQKVFNSPEYSFLKSNERLGSNICLLGLGGSYAYGLAKPDSDLDVRGVALNQEKDLIGLSNFEQFNNDLTDTVIYGTTKFTKLLAECNPNIIEILGLKPSQIIYISPIGQKFLDNKNIFLSQRVYNTFGGYALAQLRKLDNALSQNTEKQELKEEHILNSIKRYERTWDEQFKKLNPEDNFSLSIGKSNKVDLDSEIFLDVNLHHYPLRDTHAAIKGMTDIVRDYDKLQHRNNKHSDDKLAKHMSHLVRLYRMGAEILRTGEINTLRDVDRQELLDIKNGKFINSDGSIKPEFREYVNELEKDLNKALSETKLPKHPDYEKIEQFLLEINRDILLKKEA